MVEQEVILKIAEQLNVSATHIYTVLVQSQPMVGMLNILFLALWIVMFGVGVGAIVSYAKKHIDEHGRPLFIMTASMIYVLMLTLIVSILLDATVSILVPEYATITYLIGALAP